MSIRASVLNRSIRPRRRSLTLGCVTRRIFAASACLSPLTQWPSEPGSAGRHGREDVPLPPSRTPDPGRRFRWTGHPNGVPLCHAAASTSQRSESVAAEFEIVRGRLLRLLLERVKDVNRVSSRRQVEHAVGPGDVNPNLTNARSDRLHGLPIVWFESLLDAPELETSQPPCERRKRSEVTPRAAEPDERFVRGIGHVNRIQCLPRALTGFRSHLMMTNRKGAAMAMRCHVPGSTRMRSAHRVPRPPGRQTIGLAPIARALTLSFTPTALLRLSKIRCHGDFGHRVCQGLRGLDRTQHDAIWFRLALFWSDKSRPGRLSRKEAQEGAVWQALGNCISRAPPPSVAFY